MIDQTGQILVKKLVHNFIVRIVLWQSHITYVYICFTKSYIMYVFVLKFYKRERSDVILPISTLVTFYIFISEREHQYCHLVTLDQPKRRLLSIQRGLCNSMYRKMIHFRDAHRYYLNSISNAVTHFTLFSIEIDMRI